MTNEVNNWDVLLRRRVSAMLQTMPFNRVPGAIQVTQCVPAIRKGFGTFVSWVVYRKVVAGQFQIPFRALLSCPEVVTHGRPEALHRRVAAGAPFRAENFAAERTAKARESHGRVVAPAEYLTRLAA